MSGVVVFDPAHFRAMFPRFASMSDETLGYAFETACLLVDNTPSSPIPLEGVTGTPSPRQRLLYLATAHMMELETRGADTVGRVASASQGSVSVSFEAVGGGESAAYWNQTQYGALFWKISLPYRLGPLYVTDN